MKKITLVAVLLFTFQLFAQPGMKRAEKENFTPEQQAELRTKQLALALDLNDKQMAEVKKLELGKAKEREAFKEKMKEMRNNPPEEKPDAQKRYEQKNAMLDRELQHQDEMKKILTPQQFEKWQQMREDQMHKMKEKADKMDKKGMKAEGRPFNKERKAPEPKQE